MKEVTRLLKLQCVITGVLAVIWGVIIGQQAAFSALLAGITALLPSILFAKQLFRYQGAKSASRIVKNFYRAEGLKFFSSMILFTLVFILCKITPLVFFISYIVVVISAWFPLAIKDSYRLK